MIKNSTASELSMSKAFDQIIRAEGGSVKSKRNSFFKSLFLLLKRQPYGVLNEKPHFHPFLTSMDSIDIVVIPDLVVHLITFFNQSKHVEEYTFKRKEGVLKVNIEFVEEPNLEINFIYEFISKGLFFMGIKKMLLNAEVNGYDIKQIRVIDSLEYLFCASQISGSGFPELVLTKIIPSLKSERLRFYNYINLKYQLGITSAAQLVKFNQINNRKVLKVIHSKKENKGVFGLWRRFVYWKERASEVLNNNVQFKITIAKKAPRRRVLKTIKAILGAIVKG